MAQPLCGGSLHFDPAAERGLSANARRSSQENSTLTPVSEAARRLGVTQPRISRLLKGKWEDFSLDMLLTLATRAGLKPSLRLAA